MLNYILGQLRFRKNKIPNNSIFIRQSLKPIAIRNDGHRTVDMEPYLLFTMYSTNSGVERSNELRPAISIE